MNAPRLPLHVRATAIVVAILLATVAALVLLGGAAPARAANSTIGVSNGPANVALSTDGSTLYVVNQGANSVWVINAATHATIAMIPVGSGPYGIAVRPGGAEVWVSNLFSDTVSVISTTSNTVIATFNVHHNPYGVAFSKDGATAFIVSQSLGGVDVITASARTPDPVTPTISTGSTPFGIAISPDGSTLYVTNQGTNNTRRIDVASKTALSPLISTPGNPFFVTVNPAGTRVYVGALGGNSVAVIDTSTNGVVATVALGAGVRGLAVSPTGRYLFVATDGQPLKVIDTNTNTVVTSPVPLPLGLNSSGMVLSPDGATAYVANASSDNISVLDVPREAVITSSAPTAASAGTAYSFTVAATGFPAATLALAGTLPAGLTFDPATGIISGIPAAAGTSSFTITATGAFGDPATSTYSLTVAAALAPTGADATPAIATGLFLLLSGSALLLIRRRARTA